MKKHHTLIFLVLFVLLFAGCEKAAPQPEATTDLTTSAATTTITSTTEEPTTEEAFSKEQLTETREWLFNNGRGAQFYIRLPKGMHLDSSIINDANRPHEADNPDWNVSAGDPRKVGETYSKLELPPRKTLKDLAYEFYEDEEEFVDMQKELHDTGEFKGQRGNRIFYMVIESETFNPYLYHFWIELDETQAAWIWFWEPEYHPETDLPRLKEIAASVRP